MFGGRLLLLHTAHRLLAAAETPKAKTVSRVLSAGTVSDKAVARDLRAEAFLG